MLSLARKYYKEPLYRNSISMILNSGYVAIFGFVFWIVAARYMPAEDVGFATSIISTAGLITYFAGFGMDMGLVRFLPAVENKKEFFSTILIVTLVFALVFSAGFIVFIQWIAPSMAFLRSGWLPAAFLAYALISAGCYLQNMALMAIRKADLLLVQNLILAIRAPLLIVIAPLGIAGVLISSNIAYSISFLFGAFLLVRYGLTVKPAISFGAIRGILGFSFGNYLAGLLGMAPLSIITIMIVTTIGAEYNAYFYIAYSIAAMLFLIPTAVSSTLFVEGSHNRPLRENVVKSLKFTLAIMIPLLALIFVFGKDILSLFSEEYARQSLELLWLLALSGLCSVTVSIYNSIKRIQKDVKAVIYTTAGLATLLIGLGYILSASYGLIGLGYAWLISYILASVFVVSDLYVHDAGNKLPRLYDHVMHALNHR